MPQCSEDVISLPPQRAFVVQVRAGAKGEPELFAGRVEHITSGHATRFQSMGELLAFINRVLVEVGE